MSVVELLVASFVLWVLVQAASAFGGVYVSPAGSFFAIVLLIVCLLESRAGLSALHRYLTRKRAAKPKQAKGLSSPYALDARPSSWLIEKLRTPPSTILAAVAVVGIAIILAWLTIEFGL